MDEEIEVLKTHSGDEQLPHGIVSRVKRIHGWLGVQRYPDPDDFGIDFIRNGRKILRRDKSLFYFENPLTGTRELEYPLELGATVGGRLVGEIHIDHVPPNYQKNDFDRNEATWHEVVETLRGIGPIRPIIRKANGYLDENTSPLARLVKGYAIVDMGTKHLVASPHGEARKWAAKFRSGDSEYQSDDKWFESAREADRLKADKNTRKTQQADPGTKSSDNMSTYLTLDAEGGATAATSAGSGNAAEATPPTTLLIEKLDTVTSSPADPLKELTGRSRKSTIDSRDYGYPGCKSPFSVTTWEVINGRIGEGEDGDPCQLYKEGHRVDFFYNPRHPFLRDYHVTHQELLLVGLADRFRLRDTLSQELPLLFAGMITENMADTKLDLGRMQEAANTFFNQLKEKAPELLSLREQEVIDHVHEAVGAVEEIANALLSNTDLLRKFQSRNIGAINALSVAPARTMVRLVDRFPEEFFDGKFFRMPYTTIELPDPNSTERLRNESKERLLSFLKDALWVISESRASSRQQKAELARCLHSLNILEQEIES